MLILQFIFYRLSRQYITTVVDGGFPSENKVMLWWETENNISFPLPVEVKIAGEVKRLDMTGSKGEFTLAQNEEFTIDANERLLMVLVKD